MGRPRKLWSLDGTRWMGRDHQNLGLGGQASRFVIATLKETQGISEETLSKKDIQLLHLRYQERLVESRGEKTKEKLVKKEDSIQFLFDRFLWDFIQPRRSRATFIQYRASLGLWIQINGDHGIKAYNSLMELAFENHLKKMIYRGKPLLDTTINKHQRHVQGAFNWLKRKKLIDESIFIEKIQYTKQPTHSWVNQNDPVDKLRILKQFEELVISSGDPHHLRVYMLARYALMRASEIWSLPLIPLSHEYGGININRGIIQIRDVLPVDFKVKKRQGRNIKMGRKLFEYLKEDYSKRSNEEIWYLDSGEGKQWRAHPGALSMIFAKYRDQLGLTGDPLHTLRKSGITQALDAGGALEKVSKWAGHSSSDVTLNNYTDWDNIDMDSTVNLLQ